MFWRQKEFFLSDLHQETPQDFLKSQWQREEKCIIYLCYRLIVAVFFIASVAFSIFINISRGDFTVYFIYLTHLNLCFTMFSTCLGASIVSLHHFNIKLEAKVPKIFRIYWELWNQSLVISLIVSPFYWLLLYEGDELDLNNVLVHGTNSIVLVIDLFIVKHPPKYLNFIYLFSSSLTYVIFTVIYQFLGGLDKKGRNFVYPTADWKHQPLKAFICVNIVLVAIIVIHFAVNFVHQMRRKLHEKIFDLKTVDTQKKTVKLLMVRVIGDGVFLK